MVCLDQPLAQDPIFVVGYPRSGTTLLQALLVTQDELVTFPETHFFSTVFAGDNDFGEFINFEAINNILEDISKKSGITFDDDFIRGLKSNSGKISIKHFFESLVCKLFPETVDFSKRWIEKTPDHGLYMEQIAKFYPEAKFVGIIRNPFFAIYSRTRYFPPKTRDLLEVLAKQWVSHVKAFEEFTERSPKKTYLVKYEDLTADPENSIARICQFLCIEFDSEKLSNFQNKAEGFIQPFEHWKKDVKASKIYIRKQNPKSVFPTRKILKIQSIVLEKMKKYGYGPQNPMLQRIYNFFM